MVRHRTDTTRALHRPSVPIVGHRGLSHAHPENSAASIAAAATQGLYGVEVDLRASADGIPFLVHDPDLERIAGRPERVEVLPARTLAQVSNLIRPASPADPHAAPPPLVSFAHAYRHAPPSLRWFVEIKYDPRCVHEVARIWAQTPPPDGSAVMSFDRGLCQTARATLPPNVRVARVHYEGDVGTDFRVPIVAQSVDDGLDAVALHGDHIDARVVTQAHEAGLAVFAWTINLAARARALATDGVDLIISDGTDEILEIARAAASP